MKAKTIRTALTRAVREIRTITANLLTIDVPAEHYRRQNYLLPEHDAGRLRRAYLQLEDIEWRARRARAALVNDVMAVYGSTAAGYVIGHSGYEAAPTLDRGL